MNNHDQQPRDVKSVDGAAPLSTTPGSHASTVVLNDSDGGSPSPSQALILATPAMNVPPASEAGRELAKDPVDVPLEETDKFKPYQYVSVLQCTLKLTR